MLGKNNFKERLRKMEMQAKKDRFSIRKLAIGAASVLLGFSFMGITAQSAKADTFNPVKQDKQEIVSESQTSKTVGGGVLHSPSTEAVSKNTTASSTDKAVDTAAKQDKENNSTSASNTGAISDIDRKPNLATFPGLTLFFQVNEPEAQNRADNVNTNKQQTNIDQPTAPQNKQAESDNGAADTTAAQGPITEQSNEQVKEQSDKTEDSTQTEPAAEKQPVKPDLSTFPGLSMFFTDVKNADAKDNVAKTPAQDTNADKNDQDQTNAEGDKTPSTSLTPAEKIPVAPKKDAALTAAASDLQSAIDKGNAYVNSDKFTQMTIEKQKQLRDAIQTGKELMAKYNTMQAAMNSAALEVDQNNKNKAETKANANVAALTTLNVNNNTPTDTKAGADNTTTDTNKTPATDSTSSSTNTTVTTPELTQAAQSIITLLGTLGAVNSKISWDPTTKTATIGAGEIEDFWSIRDLPAGAEDQMKHIKITGPVTHNAKDVSTLFSHFSNLEDITGLAYFDTSNLNKLDALFSNDPKLKSIDVSHFNTNNVTSMNSIFMQDSSLTNIIGLQNWHTDKVTDMNWMFGYDTALTSLDLSGFNTANVKTMYSMFNGDTSLKSLNVGSFNTSNVTTMENMFNSDSSLTSLNISNFDTKTKSTTTTNMFAGDDKLEEINLGPTTLIGSDSKLFSPGYDDPVHPTKIATLTDGKDHHGTWYSYANGTINFKFINTANNKQIGTAKATGHTNAQALDFTDSKIFKKYITDNMPKGYQYSRMDSQNASYSYAGTTVNVYVTGSPVPDDGIHTVIVKHYLEGTTDKVPNIAVDSYTLGAGEAYGTTVTAKTTDIQQKAPNGYELVPGQSDQSYTLDPNATTQKQLIFYYRGITQNNVTINYVNAKTGKNVGDPYKPSGRTGKTINLKGKIPAGYHYATDDELTGTGYKQPDAKTTVYTTDTQTISVYVMGDSVPNDGTNKDAVHVLHYLESQDNKPTTDKVPGIKVNDYWLGGVYGDTVNASGTDEEQKAPTGYTLVNPGNQSYKLVKDASTHPEFIFYYKADTEAHLSVQFVNARTGKDVGKAVKAPDGYMNKPFDPTDSNSFIKTSIPDGYHYATTSDELNGETQPKNDGSIKYTDQAYTVTVYVAGDDVPDDGTNKDAVHVWHYLESQDDKPTTDKVPGIKVDDYWLGGAYGDTVTASGTDEKQKAPTGYTIVNPKEQSYELIKGATTQPEFIFYYKADKEANLSVQYVNARTGKDVGKAIKAPDGYMDKPFDPTDDNSFITANIPDGYHYAKTSDELNGETQPKNDGSIKYTDQAYTVTVYVAGDDVPDDGTNKDAVHVWHYLESQDDKPTTDKVPGIKVDDYWLGGAYGDTVTASGTDEKQKAPTGYTIVNPKEQSYELIKGATTQPEFIFYYKADKEANLSVQYVNARTGKDVGKAIKAPDGYMDKPFDPTDDNSFITANIPDGYHYAKTSDELNGKTQPKNDGSIKYTDKDDTVTVYVAGDNVPDDGTNKDAVHVLHYLESQDDKPTTDAVPGMDNADYWLGGYYGDTVTASGTDAKQKAPAGYTLVNPGKQSAELTKRSKARDKVLL
ncbi:BspA family leucine-rich repeat surface protein [Lactobacillus acetotolerans]|uniref:BspA family leucine-rich repeat surface protein n=3 Tax=Lactobacillus acetotolerans TaxID=1600 RepID=A0A5P5ZI99_9LACO|nr:BspA family leucine-rich repeat surface protein [Lactobacillus acetotolerans]QFG51204.1 BspA family leucine-rich repeat surface protein [Lactobacillus acetotolerans]